MKKKRGKGAEEPLENDILAYQEDPETYYEEEPYEEGYDYGDGAYDDGYYDRYEPDNYDYGPREDDFAPVVPVTAGRTGTRTASKPALFGRKRPTLPPSSPRRPPSASLPPVGDRPSSLWAMRSVPGSLRVRDAGVCPRSRAGSPVSCIRKREGGKRAIGGWNPTQTRIGDAPGNGIAPATPKW